jgi:RimJ/RimL family protein N-acetyltransferase
VFDFDHAALACDEKLGFVREGEFRQYAKVGDEEWNLVSMGFLRQEWECRKI